MRALSVSLSAVLFTILLSLPALPGPGPDPVEAGSSLIQPGDFVNVGGAGCTLNFVYDGAAHLAGKVYVGTAAHCVQSVGQSASTSGITGFGTVAYIDSACCASRDFAFIEVKPQYHDRVSAGVRGHPDMPTGHTTNTETSTGDPVLISGYGGIWINPILRHHRYGTLYGDSSTTYTVVAPVYFGDSGGPVLHPLTGEALGVVSRGIPPAYDTGPTVQGLLAKAAADGFPVTMRTV